MSLQRLKDKGLRIFLTGAGVSAESGIPTFRGREGYWTVGAREYHPQELATYRAFCQTPSDVWSWYLYRRHVCRSAMPNAAHLALVELEKILGDKFLLVTQNVDGLHLRSGNSRQRTYEVHGNIDYFRCADNCSSKCYPLGDDFLPFAKGQSLSQSQADRLKCPRCQAWARPHILWFDECYDEEHFRYQSSRDAAAQASALISVGTSGSTNLPLQMALLAESHGAFLIDINPEQNSFSQLALQRGGHWLREKAAEGLSQVVRVLHNG